MNTYYRHALGCSCSKCSPFKNKMEGEKASSETLNKPIDQELHLNEPYTNYHQSSTDIKLDKILSQQQDILEGQEEIIEKLNDLRTSYASEVDPIDLIDLEDLWPGDSDE